MDKIDELLELWNTPILTIVDNKVTVNKTTLTDVLYVYKIHKMK